MRKPTQLAIPTIETDRLILRKPSIGDFDGYASIVTTERGRFIGGPFDREAAWLDYSQMVAGWVLRGFGALSIATKERDQYVGTVLVHHEFGDPEPELGWLLTTAGEGHGYAFEAGRAMLNWAFSCTRLHTLVSYMDPRNHRAIALATRLGGRQDEGAFATPQAPVVLGDEVVAYRYSSTGVVGDVR